MLRQMAGIIYRLCVVLLNTVWASILSWVEKSWTVQLCKSTRGVTIIFLYRQYCVHNIYCEHVYSCIYMYMYIDKITCLLLTPSVCYCCLKDVISISPLPLDYLFHQLFMWLSGTINWHYDVICWDAVCIIACKILCMMILTSMGIC